MWDRARSFSGEGHSHYVLPRRDGPGGEFPRRAGSVIQAAVHRRPGLRRPTVARDPGVRDASGANRDHEGDAALERWIDLLAELLIAEARRASLALYGVHERRRRRRNGGLANNFAGRPPARRFRRPLESIGQRRWEGGLHLAQVHGRRVDRDRRRARTIGRALVASLARTSEGQHRQAHHTYNRSAHASHRPHTTLTAIPTAISTHNASSIQDGTVRLTL